jgi:RHS repeat-associated protein
VKESTPTGGNRHLYLYNAANERIATIEMIGGQQQSDWTVRDDAGRVLRRFTRHGNGTWTWNEDYIHRGSLLLAAEVASPEKVRHFHLDHLGTPRLITGNGGAVIAQRSYGAFGRGLNVESTPAPAEAAQFTGHERDSFQLDYMHARYYDPMMGRFLSGDPKLNLKRALRQPQNWNRYSYVMNNPLKYTDPTGEDVSIRLRFEGDGWTHEDKKKIIAQVTSWYRNQNVGKVYVFDGANASHGGNFFSRLFSGGYTSIAVSSASGEKHTSSTVFAGNYNALSGAQRINAISNTIIHETVAHHFRATLANETDYRWYNRNSAYGWYTAISSRYGTVADSWAAAERATRGNVINGPIPIHPEDRSTLQQKLRDEEVEPPDYE